MAFTVFARRVRPDHTRRVRSDSALRDRPVSSDMTKMTIRRFTVS